MLNIRRSCDRLIFKMEIPIPRLQRLSLWWDRAILLEHPVIETLSVERLLHSNNVSHTGLIPGVGLANKRQCYIVMWPFIGWAHTQNDHCPILSIVFKVASLVHMTTPVPGETPEEYGLIINISPRKNHNIIQRKQSSTKQCGVDICGKSVCCYRF